jgi:hypothetical protein
VQGLRGLLVPTRKRLRPGGRFCVSPNLSHFKVYAVTSAPPPEEEGYRVQDQFGRRGFRLHTPVAMAIPVLQGGPRRYSFIRDHIDTHLLFQPIDPVDPARARIDSFDQVGKHRDVQLRSAKYYASPAIKRLLPRLPAPGRAVPR